MSEYDALPAEESPVSPTEERLGRFLDEALSLLQRGQPVDVPALLADRPDLVERGQRDVEALEVARRLAPCGSRSHAPSTMSPRAPFLPTEQVMLPDPFPGEFRINRLLGEGTFGKVWLADEVNLGRQVALKTLHLPAEANPSALDALRKEAHFLARLDHRNVVKVHAWREAGGEHYLVLEYVCGGSLAELLKKEGPLPWQRAARYLADVAEGLREVHACGIVHRDIKASNILWDSARDEAKLTDFGVAGRLGATRTAAGRPVFMAPEALLGRATAASDVYGLAATLFHLTTGELPFPATTLEVLADNARRGLPEADVRFRQVPQRVEEIIRAGLAAAEADRPLLPRFIELLWGALNQAMVDDFLPRSTEGASTPAVGLRMAVSRKAGDGWRPVATTRPRADALSRDIRRVPPRPAQVRVRTGEPLRIEVEADRPGYLAVFNVGPTGNLHLLYPMLEHGDLPTVEAGRAVRFDNLVLEPPAGRERLLAVWSSTPLPANARELRCLVEGKGEDGSRASRSSRDILRVQQAVAEAPECRVVVLGLEHEPSA
jgi:serine/threonine protein kinase